MTSWFHLFFFISFVCFVNSDSVQVDIIHITDVHGWVNAHPHEPNLDADFGDFTSFVERRKQQSESQGHDFFLFDTGDILEGTGYSDASPLRGEYLLPIVQSVQEYSGLTMGNHDMEYPEVVDLFREDFIPYWNQDPSKPRYLTDNQFYKPTDSLLGAPWSYFKTNNGLNVLVLGFIFNFTSNSDNTYVMAVNDSLQQPYIKEALSQPDIHILVTVCHIDTSNTEMQQIYQYLRASKPNTALILLAGHRHIKTFTKFDSNAFTIESGRYFETLGLISFTVNKETTSFSNLQYEWIDTTKQNFYSLTNTTSETFLTSAGQYTKDLIAKATFILGLDDIFGCSPMTYKQHDSISKPTSLYNLYVDYIVPLIVFNQTFSKNEQYFMTNTNTLRYDLYQGPVNRNDIYTISPFNNTYSYYPDLPGSIVLDLISTLGFYHTYASIDTARNYDVVVSTYDTQAVDRELAKIGASDYSWTDYPTQYNSTGALQAYVEQYMPCSSDCPCS